MPITDPELKEITESFQQLANNAFNDTTDEAAQEQVVKLLNEAMRNYTKEWRVESGFGCPDGWTACPDGSCVPDGTACGELMSFKAVNAYIENAAEFYFASAGTDALQARTRELLQEARETFEAKFISEVKGLSDVLTPN